MGTLKLRAATLGLLSLFRGGLGPCLSQASLALFPSLTLPYLSKPSSDSTFHWLLDLLNLTSQNSLRIYHLPIHSYTWLPFHILLGFGARWSLKSHPAIDFESVVFPHATSSVAEIRKGLSTYGFSTDFQGVNIIVHGSKHILWPSMQETHRH